MPRREWVALVALLALVAALAFRPSIRGNDGVGYYVYLSSLLADGDLDFTDDYRRFDEVKQYGFKFANLPVSDETGLPTNRYGIGSALLWSPFVVATHVALVLVRPETADAVGRPYEWAVGLATLVWGSLGLVLLYRRLRPDFGPLAAAMTLVGLVLASPLGFYLYAHGSMSHGVSFFAMTCALLAFERAWGRQTPLALAACGLWFGLVLMIRVQDVSWVVVLGGALTLRLFRSPGSSGSSGAAETRPLAGFAAMAGTATLIFMPQLAVWNELQGSWLSGPAPYLEGHHAQFDLWPRHTFEALISGRRGVLVWHPLFAAALAGLLAWTVRAAAHRAVAFVALAGFAAQALLVGCWSTWWAGASFGNRFFISSLPFLALGIAPWFSPARSATWRKTACASLALLCVWNLGLLVQYATQMLPREGEMPWSQIIRQNLIDVPRFLLDRLSN